MRTDAMLFNVGGQMDFSRSNRMDRTQNTFTRKESVTGFGNEQETQSRARFQETYNEVARANSNASKVKENDAGSRSNSSTTDSRRTIGEQNENLKKFDCSKSNRIDNSKKDNHADHVDRSDDAEVNETVDETSEMSFDEVAYDNEQPHVYAAITVDSQAVQSENVDTQDTEISDAQATEASDTIKQALIDIADMLQLNIVSGLDKVSFEKPTSETVDQFTQIVHDLKTIIGALDASVAQGEPIDTGKKVIENGEASDLLVKLNAQLFKVEMGINILGKAGDVQSKLAQMTDTAFSSGIPQAMDPSQIAVSSEQMKKIFGKALNQSGESSNIEQLVKKINELVKDAPVETQQIKVVDVSSDSGNASGDTASYDTMIYRALLKLEKHEKTVSENADALVKNGDKAPLLANADAVIARDVSVDQVKVEQTVQLTEISLKTHQTQQTVSQELRSAHSLPKVIEQSVVNQISDKLNNAIRNGVTEVRVHLRPESLGEVTIKIRIEGDLVTAKMQVENQQVKAIVENNFQSLRDSLSQQNLQAGTLQVDVQSGNKEHSAFEQGFVDQQNGSHREKSSGDSSEENAEPEPIVPKAETGRRFGSNSVEYFA